jgi:hypothetical protein
MQITDFCLNRQMKFSFFVILMATTVFGGCKKSQEEPYWGEISNFNNNGKPFLRDNMDLTIFARPEKVRNCSLNNFGIHIQHKERQGVLSEWLDIGKLIIGKTGKFQLTPDNGIACDTIPSAHFSMVIGGDVIVASYALMKKADNTLTIESYDPKTQEMQGRFDMTLVENGTSETSRKIYPDTLRFTDAKFKVRLTP